MDEELKIGRKVQQFRKKQSGLSLRELAARVELSPSMLSQIENGAVNPSINTLKNIAQALRVPLFRFFKEDPPAESADRAPGREPDHRPSRRAGAVQAAHSHRGLRH